MEEPRSGRHHVVKLALMSLVAAPALTVLATAPAFAGQSDQGASSSQSASSDHAQGNAGTSGTFDQRQPNSTADDNPGGANGQCGTGTYCSTRHGAESGNGNQEQGRHTGEPCAGCVGKADNKNPPGQETSDPWGTFPNNGYECDHNSGIGQTNPAHTGCTTTSSTTTEVSGHEKGGEAATACSDEPNGSASAQDSECAESGDESGEESGEHQADTSDQQSGRTISEMPAMQPAVEAAVIRAPEGAPLQQPALVTIAQPQAQPQTAPAAAQPESGQVPAAVLGESLTAPQSGTAGSGGSTVSGGATGAAAGPSATVLGEQLSRGTATGAATGTAQLPFTGSPVGLLSLLGAAAVACGGGLLLVTRRRVTG